MRVFSNLGLPSGSLLYHLRCHSGFENYALFYSVTNRSNQIRLNHSHLLRALILVRMNKILLCPVFQNIIKQKPIIYVDIPFSMLTHISVKGIFDWMRPVTTAINGFYHLMVSKFWLNPQGLKKRGSDRNTLLRKTFCVETKIQTEINLKF